ncbi:helix-turn-helix transcriptional regulator [bacterium]|nr:helix-turn-helix transcriptional regulator [bacterium]
MNKISTKLGQNLKKIRTQKKMSQGDIARNLGVDRGYISNIENGKKNPTLATVDKLAKALGVPADELLK